MTIKEIVVGLDIGGTNIKLGLVNKNGGLVASKIIPTKHGAEPFWERIVKECYGLLIKNNFTWQSVLGVGIGIPALLNSETGYVYLAPNLGWRNVALLPQLNNIFPAPVKLENDANLAALGEAWVGAGKGAASMIMITVGTGIGSGFIYRNQIYKGEGVALELGHMVIADNGPQCSCGNFGCLEALAAAPALVKRMAALVQGEGQGRAAKLTVKEIFKLAHEGEQLALQAITETAACLGVGVANIINIFNPQIVVIGGGVSQGGEIFFKPVLETVKKKALQPAYDKVTILPAALANEAGIVGGGALFWR